LLKQAAQEESLFENDLLKKKYDQNSLRLDENSLIQVHEQSPSPAEPVVGESASNRPPQKSQESPKTIIGKKLKPNKIGYKSISFATGGFETERAKKSEDLIDVDQ
jgi:hypothetical protein